MISDFPTTYEDDSLILKSPNDLSQREQYAVLLRREEKGLLLEAREIVKNKWLSLLLK